MTHVDIMEHPFQVESALDLAAELTISLPSWGTQDSTSIESTDGISQKVATSLGEVWLEGDCIICGCPECGAPMNMRLWLSLADCWQCGITIELTQEQIKEFQRLADQQTDQAPQVPPHHSQRPKTIPAGNEVESESQGELLPAPATPPGAGRVRQHHFRRRPQSRRSTPAWLVSLVLHLIAILLLALITIAGTSQVEEITLSTFVGTEDIEGGDVRVVDMDDQLEFDLPLPSQANLGNRKVREALVRADQDARELRVDPQPLAPREDIEIVKEKITTKQGPRPKFVARDPRVRTEMVSEEGGTTLTEASVARGLKWLANNQNSDGSWSLKNYERSYMRNNKGDVAGTSLALLPFLGAGQTHENGVYRETVSKGLRWLIKQQKSNGDFRGRITDNRGMYAHGQASIVVIEALAMSGDERFRESAQKAVDYIVAAQHEEGGWRYQPGQAGDTSVFGWQLMALQSAKTPGLGLRVPDETIKLASYYLDLASTADGSLYRYQPQRRSPATPTMTAEALLCRMYLGWTRDDPRLNMGLEWLIDDHPPSRRKLNVYYWYYATQALHHFGGPMWKEWNSTMRDLLVKTQDTRGKNAGSWSASDFEYGGSGGRIYVTSLAVCTLEVYYRHLPLFKQIDLGEESDQ